jgi:hypothetical protein
VDGCTPTSAAPLPFVSTRLRFEDDDVTPAARTSLVVSYLYLKESITYAMTFAPMAVKASAKQYEQLKQKHDKLPTGNKQRF